MQQERDARRLADLAKTAEQTLTGSREHPANLDITSAAPYREGHHGLLRSNES